MRLDVDAPVRARSRAQHAGRAVVLVQRDDATCTNRRCFLFVRILDRVRALGQGAHHRVERDAESLYQSWNLRHQNTTFKIAVTMMFTSDTGIRTFHANRWS